MIINYIETRSGKKLFSFHRHDFQMKEGVGIDGGNEYIRVIGNPELKEDKISNLIEDIREQFTWGKSTDKEGNKLEKIQYILLKDLETSHIINIIAYFFKDIYKEDCKPSKHWKVTQLIFIEELVYRTKKGAQSEQDNKKQ